MGYDYWQRELSQFQQEDYQVVFVRLGMEINPTGNRGWMFGLGVKYPVWVDENAHFDDDGYDQNQPRAGRRRERVRPGGLPLPAPLCADRLPGRLQPR